MQDDHIELEIAEIKETLKSLTESVARLNAAFETASTLLGIVRWITGVATGVAGLYLLLTGHYK